MTTLAPTHHCFDDALDFITECARERNLGGWQVIHAVCCSPHGEIFAHAWVERPSDGIAVSAYIINGEQTYVEVPTPTFYEWYLPLRIFRYSIGQALRLNFRSGHYGPWEEAVRRLCGEGKILDSLVVEGGRLCQK